ncbi:EexN family lipoprotein [Pantoea sp. Mb-10]|uniref:EexN family lipoprotein n=1 Tax=unclassified Pantoea TaxID=2630326 RepID=UPI001E2A87D8|nr:MULTISPECIES: EexN family lipoprotein [unclassified Pantoea]MCE0490935.1 EexN family lipoprotein [Pantoea sp. Mb-10]MCE0499907.1 EexN family lipoprotein [Pantoea sp. Pb-8]
MKTGLLLLTVLGTALLAGCKEEAQSLDWYKAHAKERNEKVATCEKDPKPRATEDCRNAIDAAAVADDNIKHSEPKFWSFDVKKN